MDKYIKEYCVGCGLCESLNKATLETDDKGFLHPVDGDADWLKKVCPAGGSQSCCSDFSKIWGNECGVYYAWSKDEYVRKSASSGGVLTEIASFLLETHQVDAILHTCMSVKNPTQTDICISTNREQLIARSGSRYSISHPLREYSLLGNNKKYAFIGKPCDIIALKNYLRSCCLENKVQLCYFLSFFCAGLPSIDAQKKLLQKMGCTKTLASLRYRGNGWPGFATAISDDGETCCLDYQTSWEEILGRDVMKMCRFCMDGIGELADISCCDAWYLDENMKLDFTNHEGRNAVFCRNEKGANLFREACDAGKIEREVFVDYKEKMKYIQEFQLDRRATLTAKICALRIMGRPWPHYSSQIKAYKKERKWRRRMVVFAGTVKRILERKI